MVPMNIDPLNASQDIIYKSLQGYSSNATDMFLFRPEDYSVLIEKFKSSIIKDDNYYSGDIFLANTIPIMDMYLGPINKPNNAARILIFPQMVSKLNDYINNSKLIQMGYMVFYVSAGVFIAIEINFDAESLSIVPDFRPIPIGPNADKPIPIEHHSMWMNTFCSYMQAWYAIQLSLLHPQIKLLFSHPQREKIKKTNYKEKTTKEYIRIKKHIVDASAFEKALKYDIGHKEYSCLCWWVRGHFRERMGKKEFVKGYWKGPLRETKKQNYVRNCGIGV